MANGRMTLSFNDRDRETGTVSVRTPVATTDLQWVALLSQMESLKAATQAISRGVLWRQQYTWNETQFASGDAQASSVEAQRETKWLVRYEADDFSLGSFEIPCANLTLLDGDTGKADMANAAVGDFVAAVEGFVKSKSGEDITIIEIKHVGRNT